ncbi:MAG: histidine kinase [Chitinophagaceae bacterium]|nr:histidine kinase [Chitinophagaceae bacterium]
MNKLSYTNRAIRLLVVAHCCLQSLQAQIPTSYSYEFYNSSHGLASSEVMALAKDVHGFLWLGTTAGLSRYDGYEFHNYSRTADNELIGTVNVIVTDKQNRLWIGSNAGLFCYSNHNIKKISSQSPEPQGVNDIYADDDGTIWLATQNGPAHFKPSQAVLNGNEKTSLQNYILPQWKSIPDPEVTLIEKAEDGTVFFAQPTQLYRFYNNAIEILHTVTDTRDKIITLLPVNHEKVFFNSIETEIHRIENGAHTNIQHRFLVQPGVDDQLAGTWFQGTIGMYYFHPETSVVSRFVGTSDQGLIWPTNMLKDDNFFWVASLSGLVKIKPSIFKVYDPNKIFPAHFDYYGITQLNNGNILLGSNRGNIIEKSLTGFSVLTRIPTPSEVKALYEDERGWLWIATGYKGLAVLENNHLTSYMEEDGLHDNSFSQFLKTTDNRLFAIGDQGVTQIIVDKNRHVRFRAYHFQANASRHAKFYGGIEAPDGTVWIGGEEGILRLLNDTLARFTFNEKPISINDMVKDRKGNVWIATNGEGVLQCVFNEKNELQIKKKYTTRDGLSTLHYRTVFADADNNVWAGSSLGISFIGLSEKYNNRVLNFNESDGFINPGYYAIKFFQSKDGVIWASTSNGFASFTPNELFLPSAAPIVRIAAVRKIKNNEEVPDSPGLRNLSYNDNSLNFSYVALDFANQRSVRYFYKLEGLDTNWIDAGEARSITYGNLSPGQYVFQVRAVNGKGTASQRAALFSFTITAPFWKSIWFIGFLIIATGLTAYALFHRRIGIIKRKAAITQQLTTLEIRSLRSQMDPHFIFNSLNSIAQLVASKRTDEGLQYLNKFSKLLRTVLEESENSMISLKDEMKILDLYLQLESLRFGSSFFYTIHADDALDEEETLLPSFLIHPLVENAIWHGLLHKEGDRRLIINFHKPGKDQLECIVKDNGIGVEAATLRRGQELNGEKRQSRGLKIVRDRLRLMQQQKEIESNLTMEDLKDDTGKISGTKVTIKFPVLYE